MAQFTLRSTRFLAIGFAAVALMVAGCNKDNGPAEAGGGSGNITVPVNGLVAFYPFSNSGRDESGNQNDGFVLGGAVAQDSLQIRRNNTDRVSLPNTVLNGMRDFTISARVRIDVLNSENYLITGATTSNFNSFLLWYTPSVSSWRLRVDGATFITFPATVIMKDLMWHHIAVQRVGALARLYVDGQEVGNGFTIPTNTLAVSPDGLIVGQEQDALGGAFSTTQAWAGDVDNLRIYNRGLNATEVAELFQESPSGN